MITQEESSTLANRTQPYIRQSSGTQNLLLIQDNFLCKAKVSIKLTWPWKMHKLDLITKIRDFKTKNKEKKSSFNQDSKA